MSDGHDPLQGFLFTDFAAQLDRYVQLLEEDQALRHAEYDQPDPRRRRLKVACNECEQPWCCNQRVEIELVEALAIYRWAAEHAPRELATMLKRGRELSTRPALDDADFFRRRVSCGFLVRGKCMVFPVRPYRCRSHYMGGNPRKCRDELAPSETYEMSPDKSLLAELAAVAEEIHFDALIEGVKPRELAETLWFVDQLARRGRWKTPRVLDWDLVGE